MKIKKGLDISTSDFWYDLSKGGYLPPEEICENPEDAKRVKEAMYRGCKFRVLNEPGWLISLIISESTDFVLGVNDHYLTEERIMLYSKHKVVLNILKSTFQTLWDKAKPVKESDLK